MIALLPEVRSFLDTQKGAKPRSAMSVAETRVAVLAGRVYQQPVEDPLRVENGSAGGVPIRFYGEPSASALLYFHGGRFFSGNLDSHDLLMRALASQSGVWICSVDYRLAPEHPYPAALNDAIRAAEWLAGRVDRLAVGGDSAGAGIAAALAIAEEAPRICWQMLFYPMLDATCSQPSYAEFAEGPWPSGNDMRRGWDLYVPNKVDRRNPRVSPLFAKNYAAFPPTYLLTVEVDSLRDEALLFGRQLQAAGIAVEHHHENGMIHGFLPMTAVFPAASRAVATAAAALRAALLPPSE